MTGGSPTDEMKNHEKETGDPRGFVFKHAVLGELHGTRRRSAVVQFRGIPFADIPARFRQSVLKTKLPQQLFDATQPGPICPQASGLPFPEMWDGPLAPDGVVLKKPDADEFRCLNLNITAPLSALERRGTLPVLVFIHGGAFMVGSSSIQVAGREIYDGQRLVEGSIAMGRPIIVVTINYRVGPLGFLASSELAAFNKSLGEAVGNYGLHDQRQALEWVARFIDGFGGDPGNLTIQGGSAGGASCHFQAQFRDTKIKRAILSSGSTLAIGAMPVSYHQKQFDEFSRRYGATGERIVVDLQTVPVRKFVEETMAGFYNPVIDQDWIMGRTMSDLVENPTAVELMIGSCAYEQDVTLAMLGALNENNIDDGDMKQAILSMLEPIGITSKTDRLFSTEILQAYGLEDTTETPSRDRQTWAEFVADLIFRIPPYLIGLKHAGSKTYLYDFQSTNPYPRWGLGYGKANHAVSDLFFFNPAGDLVEEKHRAEYSGAVQQLQREWVAVCYGELAWEPFRSGDVNGLGPVYRFANHGAGGQAETLETVVGKERAARWRILLNAAET